MALKFVIDKLDDVPEAVRSLYKKVGDKFQLDAEGAVSEDEHSGLNAKVAEFRDNNIKLKKDFDAAQAKLQKVGDLDADAARAAITELASIKAKGVTNPGDLEAAIQKAVEKATEPLAKKVEAAEKKEQQARLALETKSLQDDLWAIGEKAGVRAESKKFWLQEATSQFKRDGSKLIVVRRDGDTESVVFSKRRGAAGDPMTAEEWAMEVAPVNPELSQFYKGSGGGGAKNDPKADGSGRRIIPNDADSVSRNLADIASGKAVVHMGGNA